MATEYSVLRLKCMELDTAEYSMAILDPVSSIQVSKNDDEKRFFLNNFGFRTGFTNFCFFRQRQTDWLKIL